MEGFSYQNIFDTKGAEYIAILVFFSFLVPFWFILNRRPRMRAAVVAGDAQPAMKQIRVPEGIFFSRNHTWAFLEKSGEAKVGLDDFLLQATGRFHLETLREPGSRIERGESLAKLHQDGRELLIKSPVTGTMGVSNPGIVTSQEMAIGDPYENGWICSIRPENWVEETRKLFIAEKAVQWASGELARFRDFIAFSLQDHEDEYRSVILQDGGEISQHALSAVPEEVWKEFQRQFLDEVKAN